MGKLTSIERKVDTIDLRRGAPAVVDRIRGGRLNKIRQRIGLRDLFTIIKGTSSDQASSAWIEVLDTVKRIGNYQSVKFSDPVIHSVIEAMGGWVRLAGDMKADEEKWKQKEFERLYGIFTRNPRDKHPQYLPGLCEITNAAEGYNVINKPIAIGANNRLIGMRQEAQS